MISTFFNLFGLLSLALALVACEPEPKKILTVGTNKWPGFHSLYLARSIGAFDHQPVKLIEMQSGTETVLAFRNGSLDLAGLTLDEALTALQFVPTLKLILVMDVSVGADVLLARPEIDSLEKLRGQRVGLENTAVGAIMLHFALQAAQLKVSDIELKSVTFDHHESAFINGQIDAVVTFEPVNSELIKFGAKKLFDSGEIPGLIIDVLVTRQEIIDHHSEELKTIVAGHFNALKYREEHPEDAAVRIAPYLGVEPDQVSAQFMDLELPGLAGNRELLSEPASTLHTSIETLNTMMFKEGLLFKPVETSRLIEDGLLPPPQNARIMVP